MEQSSIPSAQLLVQQCKAYGIKNIVISPGSRNAPLTLSFTEDSFFACYSIVDERSAAFFALGMAQQIKQPVVALCTSGSALLNYYPAVAEAFYSDIPLVIVSADRPSYKIDIGDGQTIRQDNVFDRHIGCSANLKQDVSHATDRLKRYAPHLLGTATLDKTQGQIENFNAAQINGALQISVRENSPVHINIPFEEPLYDMVVKMEVEVANILPEPNTDNEFDVDRFSSIWNKAKRKMILVGTNPPNDIEQQYLDFFSKDPSTIILTETTSNLHHETFFPSIDSLVAPIEKSEHKNELFQKMRPEILLTFGGLIVSKKIKAFMREYKPDEHWHLNEKKANNTFFALTQHFKMHPNAFFEKFVQNLKPMPSEYFTFWNTRKKHYEKKRTAYLEQIPFSDMSVFEHILKHIPDNYQLQLANSSTVRYAQLFDLNPTLKVFCNRGTSGIDGSVSTAVGASIGNDEATLLITGDLSFFYDSNGLWNSYVRKDFRIIVVNNEGGGIFRILPGHKETLNFRTFFETPQQLDISRLCETYGFEYYLAKNLEELHSANKNFYQTSEIPKLLEIKTTATLNNKILLQYFDFIS